MHYYVKKEVDFDGHPLPNGPFKILKVTNPNLPQYLTQGDWTNQENFKYATFVSRYAKQIEGKPYKNIWCVFERMAKSIKTRNSRQCKSHHQKMMEQFGSISLMAAYLGLKIRSSEEKVKVKKEHVEVRGETADEKNQMRQRFQEQKLLQPFIPIVKGRQQLMPMDYASCSMQKTGSTEGYIKTQLNFLNNYENNSVSFHLNLLPQNPFPRQELQSQPSLCTKMTAEQYQKQWLEVHHIFNLWYKKVNRLIAMTSSQ